MSSYLFSFVGCVVLIFSCLWFPLICGQALPSSSCITMDRRNLAATVITVPGYYVVTMDMNIGRMTSIVLDPKLSAGQNMPNLLDTRAEYDREYGGGIEIPTKLVVTINNRTSCDWLQISLKQPPSAIPTGRAWGYHLEYAFTTSLSGIYHWITMIHYANNELTKPSDPSDNDMGTLRWIARVRDDLFDTMVFDDTYKQTFPHADQLVACPTYGPKEVTRCQLKDGSIFMSQKYDVSQSSINHTVFGWAHKTTGLGMWLISPSFEYKNGGPLNQELTTQWTQGYPVNLMQVLAAGHYGAGMGINILPQQHYEKLFGPFLVYFNHNKGNLEASWQNAKKTYLAEKPKWPYSFVDDADYQYRKKRIFGNFRIEDPSFPASTPTNQAGTILFLCQPTAQYGHCQDQGLHYWYMTVSAREGLFFFKDVRAGVYELHAYQVGTMGEYVHPTLINVTKDRFQYIIIPDIVYRPVRAGPTLWEIGYPDRTAAEYRHGDEYRQFGLFYLFPQEYPQGVNYVVPSTSYKQTPQQWRQDWNYVQPYICKQDPVTNKQKCDSSFFYIHFDFPSNIPITTITSTVLRIAIAGSVYSHLAIAVNGVAFSDFRDLKRNDNSVYSHLAIAVNGVAFSDFRDLKRNDNSVYRDGIYGQYQERSVVIPINRFRQNNNTIRFSLFGSSANDLSGIMYDYIRLEYTTATTHPNPPSTASNRLKFAAIDANDEITEQQDVIVQEDGTATTTASTSIIMIAVIGASVSGVILLLGLGIWMYRRRQHQQKTVRDISNQLVTPSTAATSTTTSSLEAEAEAEGAWVQNPFTSVKV